MAASAIQDNICIAFEKKTVTDANLRKMADIRVSYTDIICTCEICQQFPGKGCNGGKLKETLDFFKNEGFVGGADKDFTSQIEITGDIWKTDFTWNYTNCLGFFKNYCELGSIGTEKCTESNNPAFNIDTHCGNNPTTGTDKMCPNKTDKKIKDARQKGLFTLATPVSGRANMVSALDNGPLVSTMELYSDIFFHPADTVYIPRAGGSMGHFAVKIVGYVETKSTTPKQGYWKVLLPFNQKVGKEGLVWIMAGLNTGDIEKNAFKITIRTDLLKPPTL
jgi:hypothetical protein